MPTRIISSWTTILQGGDEEAEVGILQNSTVVDQNLPRRCEGSVAGLFLK